MVIPIVIKKIIRTRLTGTANIPATCNHHYGEIFNIAEHKCNIKCYKT